MNVNCPRIGLVAPSRNACENKNRNPAGGMDFGMALANPISGLL
jgi:hypothetical protein